jgi:predicted branched-subunit amino acid permease
MRRIPWIAWGISGALGALGTLGGYPLAAAWFSFYVVVTFCVLWSRYRRRRASATLATTHDQQTSAPPTSP